MQDQIIVPEGWGQVEFDLPRVCDIEPAISGQGGDDHTFAVAKQIARSTADFELFSAWMTEWNRRCQPPWTAHRLAHNVRKAWKHVHGHDTANAGSFYVPEPDNLLHVKTGKVSFKALNRIAFTAKGAYAELCEVTSKSSIPPLEELINQMYPDNPLLCRAAGSEAWARTEDRESIRGVEKEFEWLVPSPMTKKTGYTKEGKPGSRRCRDNAARKRRYLVVEFDFTLKFQKHLAAWEKEGISGRDVQAALIRHLATTGEPRAWPFLIVDTGGKSLHSWYAIHRRFSEQNALDLLARAIPFGADKRADQPEQFFRFPGGTRKSENSQAQTILFYDQKKLL